MLRGFTKGIVSKQTSKIFFFVHFSVAIIFFTNIMYFSKIYVKFSIIWYHFVSIKSIKTPQSHIHSNVTIVTTCYKNVTASNLHQYWLLQLLQKKQCIYYIYIYIYYYIIFILLFILFIIFYRLNIKKVVTSVTI